MSSPKLLFLRALLTKAQIKLLWNCSLQRISASLTLSFSPLHLVPQIRCSKLFLHCANTSPLLSSLSSDEITSYFTEILGAIYSELSTSLLADSNLFLSSPIFCSFFFLVSGSDHLEKLSQSILLLDSMHYSFLVRVRDRDFLPPAARSLISLISPPS